MVSNKPAEFYKKLKLLGEGSFGKAFLVECASDKSLAVIKQIDLQKMTENERKETLKEAKIMEALKHTNIIRFREVYKTKLGKLCIVMDYADGGDLGKRIAEYKGKNKFFPENQILDWLTQISLALKHVHERKIIHRDLKVQNVFLTSSNIVKLGDFGIARILSHTIEKAKTVVGTPYYLAPEIVQNKIYGFEADIWSLGIITYELCALKVPFDANNIQSLALKITKGTYSPIPNQYSKDLKILIAQMLLVEPSKRPKIQAILRLPIITSRIKNFLDETQYANEFSHTILHKINVFGKNNKPIQGIPIQNKQDIKPNINSNINNEKAPIKDKGLIKEVLKVKPPTPKFKDIVKEEQKKSKEQKEIKQVKGYKENKDQKEHKEQKAHPKENKDSKIQNKKSPPLVKYPSEPIVSKKPSLPNIKKQVTKESVTKNQNLNPKHKEEEKKLIGYYDKINKEEKKNKPISKNQPKEQKELQNRKRVFSENRNVPHPKEFEWKNKNRKSPEIKKEISKVKNECKKEVKIQKEIKKDGKKIQKEIKKQASKNVIKEMKDQKKQKNNPHMNNSHKNIKANVKISSRKQSADIKLSKEKKPTKTNKSVKNRPNTGEVIVKNEVKEIKKQINKKLDIAKPPLPKKPVEKMSDKILRQRIEWEQEHRKMIEDIKKKKITGKKNSSELVLWIGQREQNKEAKRAVSLENVNTKDPLTNNINKEGSMTFAKDIFIKNKININLEEDVKQDKVQQIAETINNQEEKKVDNIVEAKNKNIKFSNPLDNFTENSILVKGDPQKIKDRVEKISNYLIENEKKKMSDIMSIRNNLKSLVEGKDDEEHVPELFPVLNREEEDREDSSEELSTSLSKDHEIEIMQLEFHSDITAPNFSSVEVMRQFLENALGQDRFIEIYFKLKSSLEKSHQKEIDYEGLKDEIQQYLSPLEIAKCGVHFLSLLKIEMLIENQNI